MTVMVCPIVNALVGTLLGAYDLEVATPRALVHAGDKTSGDARSWYMISGDAKSWVVIVLHIFTVILHNCPVFEILAHRLGFLQTYKFTNIIVDIFEYHFQIMPPRIMTQSAGRATAAPQGGRTSGWTGRGCGRTRGRSGDQGNGRIDGQDGQVGGHGNEVNDGVEGVPDFSTIITQQLQNLLPTIVAQVGDQGRNQGNGRNQNGDAVNDNIRGDVRNVTESNDRSMSWLGMVAAMEPAIIQKAVQITGTLTDEAIRNVSIKKNPKKRGNGGEPSKDRNVRDDNMRTRAGNAFATTKNPVRRENTSTTPKCTTCNFHHPPETPCRTCFNCNCPRHFAKDCRVVPRNVKSGSEARGNHQNQVMAVNGGQGRGNKGNQACGRSFILGGEEARQDPNIMAGTFTLNNHYATTLIDSGADYSFVSTTFIPILGIEPSDLGFSYEIKIASGQLVQIDKVIKGCKLEIEGHEFDIKLIPFESGSFDVIIGMDWLSNHKAKIICHEKVVRIPLADDKVLRVIGERPEEKMRHLVSAKAKEQKHEEMVVVRDFPDVFPDDLSRLPPILEIEFRIELVPGAISVAKSLYQLAHSEMEELHVINGDGIHVYPSKIEAVNNWEAPRTPFKVRSFLGLARYYRRFIKNFSKIAKPLTVLTHKSKTYDWGEDQENAFQTLKDELCNAPVLALPDGPKDFVVHCDTSGLGLGCVLMQRGKVIAYASR
ncbi:putative reverse transcriptase domain-containing protein [Tanacetum coccineum]